MWWLGNNSCSWSAYVYPNCMFSFLLCLPPFTLFFNMFTLIISYLLCRFLSKIIDSLKVLLKSGADKDPELIEQVQECFHVSLVLHLFSLFWKYCMKLLLLMQIFTSWSYIIMYLEKYLIKDVGDILR